MQNKNHARIMMNNEKSPPPCTGHVFMCAIVIHRELNSFIYLAFRSVRPIKSKEKTVTAAF